MTRLECSYSGIEIAAGQPQITHKVQEFVPAAFIGEMQLKVVQVTLAGNGKGGFTEQGGKGRELLRRYRMLNYHYGVVHVASLYEVVPEKELKFMEEAEGTAGADLGGIVRGKVPRGLLDAQNP